MGEPPGPARSAERVGSECASSRKAGMLGVNRGHYPSSCSACLFRAPRGQPSALIISGAQTPWRRFAFAGRRTPLRSRPVQTRVPRGHSGRPR